MAIYGTYSIARSLVNRHKRKNPSRKHFKVHQMRGLIARAMKVNPDIWWVTYKPTDKLIEVPFSTRGEAEDFVDLLVEELKRQAGK